MRDHLTNIDVDTDTDQVEVKDELLEAHYSDKDERIESLLPKHR